MPRPRRSERGPQPPAKPDDGAAPRITARQLLAKARARARNVEEAAALQAIDAEAQTWAQLDAFEAPYDPESLLNYIELTPHLRPCIEAMAQNVVGFGYQAVPRDNIPWLRDLTSDEAREAVRDALAFEALVDAEDAALEATAPQRAGDPTRASGPPAGAAAPPDITEEQVDAALEQLQARQRWERMRFDAFFRTCCSESSFVDLRVKVLLDYESHGWGCIEVLRDDAGRVKRLNYVPGYTVRPMRGRGELVRVTESDAATPLNVDREITVHRRFPRYCQIQAGKCIYFKSFCDPRVVSRTSGKVYPTEAALRSPEDAADPGEGRDAVPANELLWFAQHDPRTPVPPPRWIGNLLGVLGGREADETNYYYLADSAIPAGILFVHGGTIAKGTRERIERRIVHAAKGAAGAGKILVVEAIPGEASKMDGRGLMPSLSWQSLREAQSTDATFTEYDKRTADRVGASFRLSPILRGYTPSDLNRATAIVALFLAEQQVFDPIRDVFDWPMNKWILPAIGVHLWQLRSNSPPTRTAEEIGQLVQRTAPHGGLTPEEIRAELADVLNKPLRPIDQDWARRPMVMTVNGIAEDGAAPAAPAPAGGEVAEQLRRLEYTVSQLVTEDLQREGLDYGVRVRAVDPADLDAAEDDDA